MTFLHTIALLHFPPLQPCGKVFQTPEADCGFTQCPVSSAPNGNEMFFSMPSNRSQINKFINNLYNDESK